MSVLIKNGRVITAVDDYMADVFIENETVTQIGKNLEMEADETIDASGKYLFPGGLDPHTHLDMPFGGTTSADDFESGTLAAAYGGTTTLIDFAIQTKGQSTLEALDVWHEKADGKTGLWLIPVYCTWMTAPFTAPCGKPAKMERWFVCMRKTELSLMKL